jgi:WD40 repeat protein/serine/threonine protein kinase
MSAARPDIKSIFGKAVALSSDAERLAYLQQACDGDTALRAEIEALLDAHAGAGAFLAERSPCLVLTVDDPIRERVGALIGPYKLLEQIGEGGFGVVFMAEQQEPVRRKVALKILKPGMDTRQVVARFEAERQALAIMDHPHIARVFDGGQTSSGRPYFVMELVKGAPITDFCDQNHLTPRQRLELFLSVCQAVQHAHQKGIIHRDLKPSNVLVTMHDTTPVVKVIDFGVAKALGQELTDKTLFTGFAQMIGTPLYMSPEQAGQSGLDVDTRTDVYALGVLLYELLTGTTPFDRDRLRTIGYDEIRRIICEEEPARPSTRISTLGPAAAAVSANRRSDPAKLGQLMRGELDWIVMKALEKDRNRRYESASAFAADVQRYLADEPVLACPPSAGYRLRKFVRRNRAALATSVVLAAGGLVAVGSLAAAVSVLAASNAEVKDALDREKTTNDALLKAIQREKLASYFQRIGLAEREVETGNVGRAEELLDECPVALRGWEWHYLKRRGRQEPFAFRAHPALVTTVAISPDGKTVASASMALGLGEIRIWERATGKQLHRLLGHLGPIGRVTFSPDGKLLASTGTDRTLRVWDASTGESVRRLPEPGGGNCVAYSPDGKFLVSGGGDNNLRVRDGADFQELRTLHGHTGTIHAAAFGPDGRVVTGSFDGTARVWDAATGREIHTLRGHAGPILGVAFRRDGTQVASCGLDGTTRVWDARTGRRDLTIRDQNMLTVGVAFSPDGGRLATGGKEKVVRVWDLRADQEALTLRGHTDAVWQMAFTPDGDQLVTCSLDGTVRVWDGSPLGSAPQPGERTLRGHTGTVLGVVFRPVADRSGRVVLASVSLDQSVRFWDAATAEETAALHGHAGPVGFVSFSRDGRRVATTDFFGVIKVWDADTRKEVREFHGTVAHAALSPDGRRVAFTRVMGAVEVRDVDTGAEVLAPFPTHAGPVMCLAFSPDGKRLATSGWDRTAAVWDAETGRRLHTLAGHRHNVMTVEFSPDGARLVTASWDKTAKLWDVATGKEVRTFAGHEDNVTGATLSPNGRWLATASSDNTVRLWDATSGTMRAVLRGHTGYVLGVAFSPDGKWLASSSGYRGRGEVKVWDVAQWAGKPNPK